MNYSSSAVFRLSLLSPPRRDGRASASEGAGVGLGEGRVRVRIANPVCWKPLTFILSPLRKGRGEQTHAKHGPAIVRVAVNSI